MYEYHIIETDSTIIILSVFIKDESSD